MDIGCMGIASAAIFMQKLDKKNVSAPPCLSGKKINMFPHPPLSCCHPCGKEEEDGGAVF
jgi:hypothetical protein